MSDDKEAVGNLASRSWRNYTRSGRAREMRREFAAGELARENDPPITDWWLEDEIKSS